MWYEDVLLGNNLSFYLSGLTSYLHLQKLDKFKKKSLAWLQLKTVLLHLF